MGEVTQTEDVTPQRPGRKRTPDPRNPNIRCAAEQCRAWAMHGTTVCKAHGGRAPQVRRKAEQRMLAAKIVKLLPDRFEPCDEPLDALAQLAGEVLAWKEVLHTKVQELGELAGTDFAGVERARAVVELYERAMDRATATLATIAKLNLDERLVRLSERQSEIVVKAIELTLADLGLTDAQQTQGRVIVAKHLRVA